VADHGSHRRHDRFAIADAIGGGLIPSTIGTCPACRAVHIDLLTLRVAIQGAWVPRRTRDLRLTVADATRLQRRRWRQLLEVIGTQRDALTRPLALGFTTLGLAGLLLTTVPAGAPFGAGAAAAPTELDRTMAAAASEAPPATGLALPSTGPGLVADARDAARPIDLLPNLSIGLLSIGLLSIGAALFGLRRVARIVNRVR
jgi:hypothetical protein